MIVKENESFRFFATFLGEDGAAILISGSPSISVYKTNQDQSESKIEGAPMILASDTTYYYVWSPEDKKPLQGTYVVKYVTQSKDGNVIHGGEAVTLPGQHVQSGVMLSDQMAQMRKMFSEFYQMNQQLRIPLILTELEDIKQDLDDFKKGLVKVLPTKSLERAVKRDENIL